MKLKNYLTTNKFARERSSNESIDTVFPNILKQCRLVTEPLKHRSFTKSRKHFHTIGYAYLLNLSTKRYPAKEYSNPHTLFHKCFILRKKQTLGQLLFSLLLVLIVSVNSHAQDTSNQKFNDTLLLQNIEVTSVSAGEKAPFTKTNLSKQEIQARNTGQDLPFILEQTPSLVANSDAGNTIGYTNMRIRGTDASRINVTLNGIPFNDAESQGTFFVDMPDIASSLSNIQIQRGVGTSSNGAGAFGATINLNTNELNKEKYLSIDDSYGSFNTWKNTIKAGTGLINNHFTVDARFSNIRSDGYIERASSNLKSFYISGAYIGANNSIRFNIISGKEKTYQAWNGVPESMLKTNRRYNSAGTDKPGDPYDNETDNFTQTHYQLFYNQRINKYITANISGFLVRGIGYYENYKGSQKFSKYGRPDITEDGETISKTDLILQKWLDNYFYGSIFSLQYAKNNTQLTFGGGYTQYDGGHYGRVIWAEKGFPEDYENYNTPADKRDFNLYGKWMQSLGSGFTSFVDVQQRLVNYQLNGFSSNPDIFVHKKYSFLNPKAGLTYNRKNSQAYLSFSVGVKEPNRKDFEINTTNLPSPEKLLDWEAGFTQREKNHYYGITLYYMKYKNQLVNTGKINDVGAYTRENVPDSYRTGIEAEAGWSPINRLNISGNIAISRNKIKNFTEYIDDYDSDDGAQKVNHYKNTDISYSPAVVAAGKITLIPITNGAINLISKYVGKQFLDNTSNNGRMLKAYYVQNVNLNYDFHLKSIKELSAYFNINNLFNKMYTPNGYTFNYIDGGALQVENYYFPMAGINFIAGVRIGL